MPFAFDERRKCERRKNEQSILWEKCHFDERRQYERRKNERRKNERVFPAHADRQSKPFLTSGRLLHSTSNHLSNHTTPLVQIQQANRTFA
jgi:hypothetical protein